MANLYTALHPSEKLTNRARAVASSHYGSHNAGMSPLNTPPPAKLEAATPSPPSPDTSNDIVGDRERAKFDISTPLPQPQLSSFQSSNRPGFAEGGLTMTPKWAVVTLVLDGSVENFDVMELKTVLAQYLSLDLEQVKVLSITRGSVIIKLRLPKSAAQTLVHSSDSIAKLLPNILSIAIDKEFDDQSTDKWTQEASPVAARAFAAALEMQQRTEEEANMLKTELGRQEIMTQLVCRNDSRPYK